MADNSLNNKLNVVSIRLVEDAPLISDQPIGEAKDALLLIADELSTYDRELSCIINLDTKNHPICLNVVSVGTLNASIVHPREVFKSAILCNASSIILVHNHPSGDMTPSQSDMNLTMRLVAAGKILGIDVRDHIIVGRKGDYLSFSDNNMMPEIADKEAFELVAAENRPQSCMENESDRLDEIRPTRHRSR